MREGGREGGRGGAKKAPKIGIRANIPAEAKAKNHPSPPFPLRAHASHSCSWVHELLDGSKAETVLVELRGHVGSSDTHGFPN